MKTLLLMRHAKSSWKDPELPDHDRPLNKRGLKDAPFMGEVLKEKELLPQRILASTALRVRETVNGLVQTSSYAGEIEFSDALYLAEPEVYLTALQALPETLERVMIIGHNPGLEGLLQLLSGRIESLSTGSIAYISLPIQNWGDLNGQIEGELVEMFEPQALREMEEKMAKEKKEKKEKEEKKGKEEKKKEKKKVEKKEEKKRKK